MRAGRLPVLITPGRSARVWLLQAGVVVNFFGNGMVAPFLVIYLHTIRGIPSAWRAYGPSAQTLLSSLVRPEQRAAGLSQQRMSALAGLGLGGLVGGLIAAGGRPESYVLLLILDACTFATFAGLALLLPNPRPRLEGAAGGYRRVFADRRLRLLAALHFVTVSAGFAPMLVLLPAFASGQAHVPAAAIGLIYLVNTAVILIVQLPITQLVARQRPLRRITLVCGGWAMAWVLVFPAGYLLQNWAAAGLLTLAMIVYALGECVHTATVTPTAAAIAPDALRGRYLAVTGLRGRRASWWDQPPAALCSGAFLSRCR